MKIELTKEEMDIISAALNNDAKSYKEMAEEDYDLRDEYMNGYNERMELQNKFDELLYGKKFTYALRDGLDDEYYNIIRTRLGWSTLQRMVCDFVDEANNYLDFEDGNYDYEHCDYNGGDCIYDFVEWKLKKHPLVDVLDDYYEPKDGEENEIIPIYFY